MANNSMTILELFHKLSATKDIDFLREGVKTLAQAVMELEVKVKTGGDRYERTDERKVYRNGYRSRIWDTRVGSIDLKIPKVREGSYFPSLLEPRRRAEKALLTVVQEAYVHGVSTRKVDDLVKSLGLEGVSKSEVSRICSELDNLVEQFRNRPLESAYPYLWLDATYIKAREDGHVLGMAAVVAVGVRSTGEREVLGLDLGPAEDRSFWLSFLRSLVARGLHGVRLVISDAHEGLKAALIAALGEATWQRCRVHFMRNVLSQIPKAAQNIVSAAVKSIFVQPDQETARDQLRRVSDGLLEKYPKVARLLDEAADDVLAYMAFPSEHRRQIHSTNTLERLNHEIKRRTDVVGIFPNRAAVIRLVGAILAEQNDEWLTGRRYFSQESMTKLADRGTPPDATGLLAAD
ncbi:MAG TPA: IS256 family transposase [Symbiobacteriaceae bacterium]|nr:IS256 family transposase [Symbiobacteriaceae bacterium]